MSDRIDDLLSAFLAALDAVQDATNKREWADYDERRLRARHVVAKLRVQAAAIECYRAALEHDRAMTELRVEIAKAQAENTARLESLGKPPDDEPDTDVAEDTSWWAKAKAAMRGKN